MRITDNNTVMKMNANTSVLKLLSLIKVFIVSGNAWSSKVKFLKSFILIFIGGVYDQIMGNQ